MSHIVAALAFWAQNHDLPYDVSPAGNIAAFSSDRTLRYIVTRKISDAPRILAGIGLNPSTADAFRNDNTITRGIGFAKLWDVGTYIMLNTDAFRATDPKDLFAAAVNGVDVCGPLNDEAIRFVFELLTPIDIALAAWGVHVRQGRADRVRELAASARIALSCLGKTKAGHPKHMLYLSSLTAIEPYRGAA